MRSVILTFLPSGIAARSTSTLAMAKTSADADMFLRNSARGLRQPRPLFANAKLAHVPSTSSPNHLLQQETRPKKHLMSGSFIISQAPRDLLTLNRRLGTHSRDRTKTTNHKVLVDQVLVRRALGRIVAEVGDVGGGALALEGALVRRASRVGAGGGRAEASDRSWYCCCTQCAGGSCEGRHDRVRGEGAWCLVVLN